MNDTPNAIGYICIYIYVYIYICIYIYVYIYIYIYIYTRKCLTGVHTLFRHSCSPQTHSCTPTNISGGGGRVEENACVPASAVDEHRTGLVVGAPSTIAQAHSDHLPLIPINALPRSDSFLLEGSTSPPA